MTVAILIPAAGFGRRMKGADKLLQDVNGKPLLRRQAERALSASPEVYVTVPTLDHPRAQAVSDLDLHLVPVPDRAEGMAASLRRGVEVLPGYVSGVMIVPGDMPDLTSDDFSLVIQRFETSGAQNICQATTRDGKPGHPVLFPKGCFEAFAKLSGDSGARDILKANKQALIHVALSDERALIDLDSPEAWQVWRNDKP